jgi:hypothetical protein
MFSVIKVKIQQCGSPLALQVHYQIQILQFLYRRESNLAISSSPVTNNNVQLIHWTYCYGVKNEKISSSAPGLSVMTLHLCR